MDLNKLEQVVTQWAKDRNIIGEGTPQTQMLKLVSELGETADALIKGNLDLFKDGVGDCCVVLIILAAQTGTSLTECLAQAYNDIKDRKGILYKGTFIKETDPDYPAAVAAVQGAPREEAKCPNCENGSGYMRRLGMNNDEIVEDCPDHILFPGPTNR